eukprot:2435874-Alexandrium_andersonii.AAC.1
MFLATKRADADVFVLPDVTLPGQRCKLSAVMKGNTLCTFSRVIDGTGRGRKKAAWRSEAFIEKHPALRKIIVARVASGGSK